MFKYYSDLENYKISLTNNGVEKDYFLPKGYFITPRGYLYNTSKTNGHRYNSFVNDYEYIIGLLEKNKPLLDYKSEIDYYNNILNKIRCLDFVDYNVLIEWVKSLYDLPEGFSLEIFNYDNLINNKLILTELYKGFCDASANFYEFFDNYFEDEPLKEYQSINDILGNVNINDKMVEILVRCIGFHKIEIHDNNKNITTTSLRPVADFYEYLMNGFNVWVVPEIINKHGFKEIDLKNSISISSYTAIENFEEENPDKGKVRILGL